MVFNQMQDSRMDVWFRQNRSSLENNGALAGPAQVAVTIMLRELDSNARAIEDMGALNRWRGRSSVPIEQYVRLWEKSCSEIGAAGWFPKRLSELLGLR
jgi:hypothetical protein